MKPRILLSLLTLALGLALTGCVAPIGADRVTTRQAYAQVEANALRTGKPSATTVAILHRYDLDRLAARQPDEAVRQLHQKALATGERDLLFALAEMSYVAGDHIRRSVKPWDPRDARDYYLGSAVYAWLFLFGEGKDAAPRPSDRRLREACDFYNYGLGLALTEEETPMASFTWQDGRRRLPVGEIELKLNLTNFPARLDDFEQFLLADQFRVRGLSVRNREPGVGAPLVAVRRFDPELGVRRCSPATVFLRLPGSLAEVDGGTDSGSLELYSPFDDTTVAIGPTQVPLETDLTTHVAYVLNQSFVWDLGMMQFLAPAKTDAQPVDSLRCVQAQSHSAGVCPRDVFQSGHLGRAEQHADGGSGVAPALSSLDFHVRQRQCPAHFGGGIARRPDRGVQKLDPAGTNALLRQMVIIGHSQGGLLTKLTATETGDRLWRVAQREAFGGISPAGGSARQAAPPAVSGTAALCQPRDFHQHPASRQLPGQQLHAPPGQQVDGAAQRDGQSDPGRDVGA